MNSIAIWSNDKIDITLHINIWHTLKKIKWYKQLLNKLSNYICIEKTNEFSNYIEFGFKIDTNQLKDKEEKLYLYIPIRNLQETDIEDKILILKDELKLVKALFNSGIDVSTKDDKQVEVNIIKYDEIIILTKLNFKIELKAKGSLLIIDLPKINDNEKYIYLRFRINKIYELIKEIDNNLLFIDGFLEKKAILEFDINHIRKLPSDIDFNSNLNFVQINCFFLTDDEVDLDPLHNTDFSARILEKHIWNDYIDNNTKFSNIVAYQWDYNNRKEENENKNNIKNSFSLLVKLNYRIKRIVYLLITIFFIYVLGIVGGISGNWITAYYIKGDNNVTTSKITK